MTTEVTNKVDGIVDYSDKKGVIKTVTFADDGSGSKIKVVMSRFLPKKGEQIAVYKVYMMFSANKSNVVGCRSSHTELSRATDAYQAIANKAKAMGWKEQVKVAKVKKDNVGAFTLDELPKPGDKGLLARKKSKAVAGKKTSKK